MRTIRLAGMMGVALLGTMAYGNLLGKYYAGVNIDVNGKIGRAHV